MENKVIKTKKGIFIKTDKKFGAIVFSPYSGLFFAISREYVTDTISYCENKKNKLPDKIAKNLNIGIVKDKNFEIKSHWLPENNAFSYIDDSTLPNSPIVINWLISNNCCFSCNYCYAGDVIDKPTEMADATEIAQKIMETNPLAVVFSGGEPLREKQKIIEGLNVLGNKVGIIIDTNGYHYDNDLAKLFQKYNAIVRVSLDSLHSELNSKIRPLKNKKSNTNVLNTIVTNITKYREMKIPVLIHTVVSSVNKNSLYDLYDKLPTLGVNGWRLFSVINPNDESKQEQFKKLMTFGKAKNMDDAQQEIQKEIEFFSNKHISKSNFSLQIVHSTDSQKNSVILVLPSGQFATESRLKNEKIKISIESIFNKVDLVGHYERYLGIIK
ncbi:MAG: radical SAM protein [Bacteroidales bacterium]|jgi:sulfatase maturation enzyme AslB (radical SAM superfamily)|nr:radical SAM protein [Bacteroidales bacterium]